MLGETTGRGLYQIPVNYRCNRTNLCKYYGPKTINQAAMRSRSEFSIRRYILPVYLP